MEAPQFTASNDDRKKVWKLIENINIAMMVTQGEGGRFYSRPMAAQKPDKDDNLWFFTSISSPKVMEIADFPDVLLSYAEPDKNNYVSITGKAKVVQDRAKIEELWSEPLRTWWPKGKDDPDICLICVTPESAEYWDSPSSAFVIGFGYVKARITGKPEEFGENKIVRL